MTRWYGRLTAQEINSRLSATTVLCLPIGSNEQHGCLSISPELVSAGGLDSVLLAVSSSPTVTAGSDGTAAPDPLTPGRLTASTPPAPAHANGT